MKIVHRFRFTLLLSLLLLPVMAVQAATLNDFNGKPHSLDEYTGKGKWLVVMIWASDCHVCNKEAHSYVDFHFVHADEDAQVLGISADGQARKKQAQAFIERHKVNFPNLIGEPEQVASLFTELTGAPWFGTPTFLIYGPDGELKAQQVGAVPTEMIEDFMQRSAVAAN